MKNTTAKKLILILVEGPSDKESLEDVLSKIVENSKVKFAIFHGDITSDFKTNIKNVSKKIEEKVEEFLNNSKGLYELDDIQLIVHIVDTDACSIDEDRIIESPDEKYLNDKVYVKNKSFIVNRNIHKRNLLKYISTLNNISFKSFGNVCKRYNAYYMSCNLEHVLHDNSNIKTDVEKEYYSMKFAFQYLNNTEEFIKFINHKDVGTQLDFSNSWINILKNENALKRETNLNLFVNDCVNGD